MNTPIADRIVAVAEKLAPVLHEYGVPGMKWGTRLPGDTHADTALRIVMAAKRALPKAKTQLGKERLTKVIIRMRKRRQSLTQGGVRAGIMRDMGMKKVKGNLGGTYWEGKVSEYGVPGMKWGQQKDRDRAAKSLKRMRAKDINRATVAKRLKHSRSLLRSSGVGTSRGSIAVTGSSYTAALQKQQSGMRKVRGESLLSEFGVPGMKWGTSKMSTDKGTGSQKGAFKRIPQSSVSVSKAFFKFASGKKPSGQGRWAFNFGKKTRFVKGTQSYSAAKKVAVRLAARAGIRNISAAESTADDHKVVAKALATKQRRATDSTTKYKFHRSASKHRAIARASEHIHGLAHDIKEYGVQGMKWGDRKGDSGSTPLSRSTARLPGNVTIRGVDAMFARIAAGNKRTDQKLRNIRAKRLGLKNSDARTIRRAIRDREHERKYPGSSYRHLKSSPFRQESLLSEYGVPGMKWGTRKEVGSNSSRDSAWGSLPYLTKGFKGSLNPNIKARSKDKEKMLSLKNDAKARIQAAGVKARSEYKLSKANKSARARARSITKGINKGERVTNVFLPGSGWKRG